MGLLDAWANAEKISYPVIGEEVKEASNVIDYNINEEVTTNTSAVFNANNDTTTGLATVIPGVNAPRLIESTSIYKNVVNKTGNAVFYGSGNMMIDEGDTHTGLLRPLSLTSQEGPYTFEIGDYFNGNINVSEAALIFPSSGIYLVECTYFCRVNVFFREYDVYVNLDKVYHLQNDDYYHDTGSAYPTESFYINANAGDQMAIYWKVYCGGGGTGNYIARSVSTQLTKVG